MSPRAVRLSAFAGVFFAVDLLTFHYVVDNIGAGLATMMGNLQVVIVALRRGPCGASGRGATSLSPCRSCCSGSC